MVDTTRAQHKIVVPTSLSMVSLLGSGDEFLRVVEATFPGADIHARGNEITVTGERGDVALVERLFDELVTILRTGQGITRDTVERSAAMLRSETTERPAEVLSLNILSNRGPDDSAEDAEPEALRRRDRQAHDRVRHRPCRHRQDLPRGGEGRAGAAGQAGQPDHPDPARGRGGGAARASCPARCTRRSTPTYGRSTTRCTT